jgi:hypothetical protein
VKLTFEGRPSRVVTDDGTKKWIALAIHNEDGHLCDLLRLNETHNDGGFQMPSIHAFVQDACKIANTMGVEIRNEVTLQGVREQLNDDLARYMPEINKAARKTATFPGSSNRRRRATRLTAFGRGCRADNGSHP